MSELHELIARLEKAMGPDRELDRDIRWIVAGLKKVGIDEFEVPETGARKIFRPGASLDYTESIDAAMTLMPDGWIWDIASTGAVWVMPDGNIEGQIIVSGIGHPAIALCIAALSARAVLKQGRVRCLCMPAAAKFGYPKCPRCLEHRPLLHLCINDLEAERRAALFKGGK